MEEARRFLSLSWVLLMCFAVKEIVAQEVECVRCPCGTKGENVRVCDTNANTSAKLCERLSNCESCVEGLYNCSRCPEGYEGSFCTQKIMNHRQKRQGYRDWSNPRRGMNSRQGTRTRCPDLDTSELYSIECMQANGEEQCTGQCHQGYHFTLLVIQTELTLTCSGGEWTPLDSFPKCRRNPVEELMYCRDPGDIANGVRQPNTPLSNFGFRQGTQLQYSCSRGYQLNGEQSVFCLASGEWTANAPRCVQTQGNFVRGTAFCPDPGELQNGVRRPNTQPTRRGFRPGNQLVNSCNQGYELLGERSLTCMASGAWNASPPRCVAKTSGNLRGTTGVVCPDPGVIQNGRQTVSTPSNSGSLQPGTRVRFTCDPGYEMQGDPSTSCMASGDWSRTPPRCVARTSTGGQGRVVCPDPGVIQNGRQTVSTPSNSGSLQPGTRVQFTCDRGYEMQGDPSTSCMASGDWSKTPPRCVARPSTGGNPVRGTVFCPDPGNLENGVRRPNTQPTRSGFRPGNQLVNSCNQGYELVGERSLMCLESGAWTASPPRCEAKSSETFWWLTEEETVSCPDPGITENGIQTSSNSGSLQPGTRIDFTCNPGYQMQGESSTSCMASGEWSKAPPRCVAQSPTGGQGRVVCPDPGVIQNGRQTVSRPSNSRDLQPGTRVQFTCDRGYEMQGDPSTSCMASGDWSKTPPRCVPRSSSGGGQGRVVCPNPGVIQNGRQTVSSPSNSRDLQPGTRIQFTCDPGYEMQGDPSTSCMTSGDWSKTPPRCIAARSASGGVVCPDPGVIENGIQTVSTPSNSDSLQPGSRIQFICDEGYEMQGDPSTSCMRSGEWSKVPPRCVPQSRGGVCGRSNAPSLPAIASGDVTDIQQWPWQAQLVTKDNPDECLSCGGSLLNELWIITTAVCAGWRKKGELQIYLGKSGPRENRYVQERKAQEVHIHPDHVFPHIANIALIKLDSPVQLNSRVQPLCLPTDQTTRNNIVEGKRGVSTSWNWNENDGCSKNLKQSVIPITSQQNCERIIRQSWYGGTVTADDTMFCAGYRRVEPASCIKDWGGPMVFLDESSNEPNWVLEGLVSFHYASDCRRPNNYVFTKVSRFLDWIERYL